MTILRAPRMWVFPESRPFCARFFSLQFDGPTWNFFWCVWANRFPLLFPHPFAFPDVPREKALCHPFFKGCLLSDGTLNRTLLP